MSVDISKKDSKMLKGVAIISMIMLHLFCRKNNLPYTPLIWIGDTPLVYYFGLFGDICIAIFCFISGYIHYKQLCDGTKGKERYLHLLRFFINFWTIVILSVLVGAITKNSDIPGSGLDFLMNCLTLKNSYNGAWWYVNTYLLLVILQPLSYRFIKICPIYLVMAFGFVFYVIGYGIRFFSDGDG